MDVLSLLEELEKMLEEGGNVPFSKKVMIDKEQVENLVQEIKLKTPDELKQARWVKEERQRILSDAQKEANDIIKEAENKIISMIDEHEITKKAYDEKDKILEQASSMAKEMSDGTKEYADNVLAGLEDDIAELKVKIDEAQANLTDALATIKNNRKELK